jgi:hypothetical protein
MQIAKTSSIGRMLGLALVLAIALALPGAAWAQKGGGKEDPGKDGGYGSSSQGGGSSGPCRPGEFGCIAPSAHKAIVRLAVAGGGWVEFNCDGMQPTPFLIDAAARRTIVGGSAMVNLTHGGLAIIQTRGGWTPPDTEREAAAREAAARYIVFFALGTPGPAFRRLASGPDALVFGEPDHSILVVHPANVPRLAMTQIRTMHPDAGWSGSTGGDRGL